MLDHGAHGGYHNNARREESDDDTLESEHQGPPGDDGPAPPQEEVPPPPIASFQLQLQPLPTTSGIISRPHPTRNHKDRPPPRRVDHTYRDYSNFPIEDLPEERAPTNFPSKLHQILSTPEHCHIISWMPHGRAWKIHDKEGLVKDVIPKYFVQTKYESFTRQLNGWGLKRLHQSGNDFNAYYHECLLRGLPRLTVLMRRAEPNKGKLLPHVEGEPNFYEIARQFPLPPLEALMAMSYHHHVGGQYDHRYSSPPHIMQAPPQPGYYLSYPGGAGPPRPHAYYGHGPPPSPTAAAAYVSHPPAGYSPYPPPYYPTQQYGEPNATPLGPPPPHGHPYSAAPHGQYPYGPPPTQGDGPPQSNHDADTNDAQDPPSPSNGTASPMGGQIPSAPAPQGAALAQGDEWAPIEDGPGGESLEMPL